MKNITKNSKRLPYFLFLLSFLFLINLSLIVPPALAETGPSLKNAGGFLNTTAEISYAAPKKPAEIIGQIINYILGFVGAIFLILTIYGGITWMTAGGNEEKIKKAKGLITSAIIGLAIVLAAYSITWFVFDKLLKATIL
jgi:hypothetical protein